MARRTGTLVAAFAPLLIAAVGGVGSLACAILSRAPKAEGLTCSRDVHEFPSLTPGETVKTTFELTNRFSQSGKIVRLIHSCACTDVRLSREKLRPGEKCTVDLELTVPKTSGTFAQHVVVAFSRPGAPNWDYVKLELKGTIAEKK